MALANPPSFLNLFLMLFLIYSQNTIDTNPGVCWTSAWQSRLRPSERLVEGKLLGSTVHASPQLWHLRKVSYTFLLSLFIYLLGLFGDLNTRHLIGTHKCWLSSLFQWRKHWYISTASLWLGIYLFHVSSDNISNQFFLSILTLYYSSLTHSS